MNIKSFTFRNNTQNWQIEKVRFDNLNLLVGSSGAGKTTILKALVLIFNVAQGKVLPLENLAWAIDFSHLGQDYRWEITTNSIQDSFSSEQIRVEISEEKLIKFEDNTEIEILHRSKTKSKLNGENLQKFKKTESAISLLAEEESIAPVTEAFKRFIVKVIPQELIPSIGVDPSNMHVLLDSEIEDSNYFIHLEKFKDMAADAPTVLTAYYLEKIFPKTFDEIKDIYTGIFPNVEDVRVNAELKSDNRYALLIEILERGSANWISQVEISSGMYRVLTCLIDILASPEESVVVIDEFENSLGINCMPQLTDFILDKSPNLQFILTSHHPYIINNIPWETWQLVSRTNGMIRARKAIDIPALDTASSLDKFTQLINFLVYEGGVA
ncbi:ATP-binding protein [Pseudanabaena sp. UWO311]|uniref:AAA family ATPase n=1 Tax=Pseudanabaena sp. UWO311 TaxID=2487337 RepID=UPI0011570C8A|nr:ATP-binding protein [Pseudanabaena sp. UWO311]TYQ24845.1 ATP-binding protein [Pseudanabaena sp. UWO311]